MLTHTTVKYPSSLHLEAHLLDAHGRQIMPGEDAAREGLVGLERMHDGMHETGSGYGYPHSHGVITAPERGTEAHQEASAAVLDRAIAGALLMAYELEGNDDGIGTAAEELVRNRLVAIHDEAGTFEDPRAGLKKLMGAKP